MSVTGLGITKDEFRRALGRFATGVTVITVKRADGQIHGMTANAFASVSLEPQLVLVCIDHRARTLPLLRQNGRFGVNVLGREQQAAAEYFAQVEQTHEEAARCGVAYDFWPSGAAKVAGAIAQLDCRVEKSMEAGDHTVFVGRVEAAAAREGEPLLYFQGRYRALGDGQEEQ